MIVFLLGYNPAGRLPAIGRANSKAPNQHAHDGAAADTVALVANAEVGEVSGQRRCQRRSGRCYGGQEGVSRMRFVTVKASWSAMPCSIWSFPSSPALKRAIRCRMNSSRSSVKSHPQALWNADPDLTPHASIESIAHASNNAVYL
jgi:hypothetical protein